MDYEALRAALARPEFAKLDDAAAAAALNAQAIPRVQDTPCWELRNVLLRTGEWGGLKLLSRAAPTGTERDRLTALAITVTDTLEQLSLIETSIPETLAGAEMMLSALVGAGALSATSRDAMLALRHVNDPVWPVVLTEHDVAGARSPV